MEMISLEIGKCIRFLSIMYLTCLLKKEGYGKGLPVVYSGQFNVDKVGDTFLDMREWGKGIVFVNGINLGRYWKVGPQHTFISTWLFLEKRK